MLVSDLDGIEYEWKVRGKEYIAGTNRGSELHKEVRDILKNKFPTIAILEEVPVRVRRGKTLYLDFYIPMSRICVEVHGEQHYSFNSMYHKSKMDFVKQKKNDREKGEWCQLNGISLIELSYKDRGNWENIL